MSISVSHKPHLLKIIPPLQKSIVVKGDEIAWNNPWHYHPEIELLYCIQGKGTNFIGNSIRAIEEGEVLLLGKNLPHTRQRDRDYYLNNPGEQPSSIVVQFREDFLGSKFFDTLEFRPMQVLINKAARGLKLKGELRAEIIERLHRMPRLDPVSSVLELLHMLHLMSVSDEFDFLNPVNYNSKANEPAMERINRVYQYSIEHFRKPISLGEVAALINYTPSSFCRYFRSCTRKRYFQYLTEIRISYACELLMQGDRDVSEVCYASGFNNLSHFHKQFKRIVGKTPSVYCEEGKLKVPPINSVSGSVRATMN